MTGCSPDTANGWCGTVTPTTVSPYYDTTTLVGCACVASNVTNAVTGADYSSCAKTGDTCSPTCLAGYEPTAAATGFTLTCDANDGSFDGADATLVCPSTGEPAYKRNQQVKILMIDPISTLLAHLGHSTQPSIVRPTGPGATSLPGARPT